MVQNGEPPRHVVVVPPPCSAGVWEKQFFFSVFNAFIQIVDQKRHRDYRDTIIEYTMDI